MMVASTSGSKSLKEYLKRYESNDEEEKKKKKRKKKVVQSKLDVKGVLVMDEDPVWQKPVNLEEENNDDSAGKRHYILVSSYSVPHLVEFLIMVIRSFSIV